MAEIQIEVDVPARMRDGTVLRAESTGPDRGLGVHRIPVNAVNPGATLTPMNEGQVPTGKATSPWLRLAGSAPSRRSR